MPMITDPNEPIAPTSDDRGPVFNGLTKREYFAAQIMAGFAALPWDQLPTFTNPKTMKEELDLDTIAADAVRRADALVKALNAGRNDLPHLRPGDETR